MTGHSIRSSVPRCSRRGCHLQYGTNNRRDVIAALTSAVELCATIRVSPRKRMEIQRLANELGITGGPLMGACSADGAWPAWYMRASRSKYVSQGDVANHRTRTRGRRSMRPALDTPGFRLAFDSHGISALAAFATPLESGDAIAQIWDPQSCVPRPRRPGPCNPDSREQVNELARTPA